MGCRPGMKGTQEEAAGSPAGYQVRAGSGRLWAAGRQHPEGEWEPVGWEEDRFAERGMDRSVCVEPRAGERG